LSENESWGECCFPKEHRYYLPKTALVTLGTLGILVGLFTWIVVTFPK